MWLAHTSSEIVIHISTIARLVQQQYHTAFHFSIKHAQHRPDIFNNIQAWKGGILC